MPKPKATHPKLVEIIDFLWSTNVDKVGDGSLADAIRYERKTGQAVKKRFHSQKGREAIRRLEFWLSSKKHPNLEEDKRIARLLIRDLRDALGE